MQISMQSIYTTGMQACPFLWRVWGRAPCMQKKFENWMSCMRLNLRLFSLKEVTCSIREKHVLLYIAIH